MDEIHQKFKEQRKNEGNLSIDENSQQLKEQQKMKEIHSLIKKPTNDAKQNFSKLSKI
jgi:hypothetical protein